jgi:DNA-binding transcriptional regulator YiaG
MNYSPYHVIGRLFAIEELANPILAVNKDNQTFSTPIDQTKLHNTIAAIHTSASTMVQNRLKQLEDDTKTKIVDHNLDTFLNLDSNQLAQLTQAYNNERTAIKRCNVFKTIRLRKNLSIDEAADALQLNRRNLQAWEAHKKNCPIDAIKRLEQL